MESFVVENLASQPPAGQRTFSIDGEPVLTVLWTPLAPGTPSHAIIVFVSPSSLASAAATISSGQGVQVDLSALEPDQGLRIATIGLREYPPGRFVLSGTIPLTPSEFFSGDIGPVSAAS